MLNATLHENQGARGSARATAATDPAPTPSCQALAPLTLATRLSALALAVLTTGLVLGSQYGLTAMYASQAAAVMAKAQPARVYTQLVAKAN